MAYWSGEKLALHLPGLITGFDAKNLDCASYRLCVGEQVFVTSDEFVSSAPTTPLVSVLRAPPNNMLRIRPGQFAFLLTQEVVRVPNDAIALISMRAGYKFKGLINVSGFHVDPGWEGKLLFSVYNAGPAEIIVELAEAMFLIVYADLDRMSAKVYDGTSKGQTTIKSSLLQNMTEQVFSPLMLQKRMREQQTTQDVDRRAAVDQTQRVETSMDGKLAQFGKETDAKLVALEQTATSTANTVKIVTFTVVSVGTLVIAVLTLFAAIAPSWFGVTLGRTLEAAGYEVKQKPADRAEKLPVAAGTPKAHEGSGAASVPLTREATKASSSTAASSPK